MTKVRYHSIYNEIAAIRTRVVLVFLCCCGIALAPSQAASSDSATITVTEFVAMYKKNQLKFRLDHHVGDIMSFSARLGHITTRQESVSFELLSPNPNIY